MIHPIVAQVTIFLNEDDHRVDVDIETCDGTSNMREFDSGDEAGKYVRHWLDGRGLELASDSAVRLSDAQRTDCPIVTLDIVSKHRAEQETWAKEMATAASYEGSLVV